MNLDMIKQARELQSKLAHAQKELKKMKVEMESGQGAVKVVMNGEQKLLSIEIDTQKIDMQNDKQLNKLVLKAVNDCQDKVLKMASAQMKDVTGGMKIPGLF